MLLIYIQLYNNQNELITDSLDKVLLGMGQGRLKVFFMTSISTCNPSLYVQIHNIF